MKTFTLRPVTWASISFALILCAPAQALQFSPVAGGPDSASVVRIDADTDGRLYVAAGSNIYSSTDNGATWIFAGDPPTGLRAVAADAGVLFGITSEGVSKSTDNGDSGDSFNGMGAGALPNFDRINTATFEVANGFVYVATQDPERSFQTFVYRSPVASPNWVDVTPTGLTSFGALISAGSNLCMLAQNNGVQFSSNNGDTWARASNTNGNFSFMGKSPDAANVYIAASSLRRSTDQCASFSQVAGNGLTPDGGFSIDVFSLGVDSAGKVYAGGNTGTLRVSSDNGVNFTVANSGDLANNTGVPIRALTASGTGMLVGTSGSGIFSNVTGTFTRSSGPASSSVNALADGGAAGAIDIGVGGAAISAPRTAAQPSCRAASPRCAA